MHLGDGSEALAGSLPPQLNFSRLQHLTSVFLFPFLSSESLLVVRRPSFRCSLRWLSRTEMPPALSLFSLSFFAPPACSSYLSAC